MEWKFCMTAKVLKKSLVYISLEAPDCDFIVGRETYIHTQISNIWVSF